MNENDKKVAQFNSVKEADFMKEVALFRVNNSYYVAANNIIDAIKDYENFNEGNEVKRIEYVDNVLV